MVLSQVALTILGGVLSAGVGLLVTGYKMRKQAADEQNNWYERSKILATQVEETVDRYHNGGTRYVTARVMEELSSLLREHASQSPQGIDFVVIEALDETAYYCESSIGVKPEESTQMVVQLNEEDLDEAKKRAQSLKQEATQQLH